jgi:hypothetical protein
MAEQMGASKCLSSVELVGLLKVNRRFGAIRRHHLQSKKLSRNELRENRQLPPKRSLASDGIRRAI